MSNSSYDRGVVVKAVTKLEEMAKKCPGKYQEHKRKIVNLLRSYGYEKEALVIEYR